LGLDGKGSHLMSSLNYSIRTMTRDEVNLAIAWAASEGWNPGLYDAESFYATDPNGFLLGEINHELIAVISLAARDIIGQIK
jgi:hypothetical protein